MELPKITKHTFAPYEAYHLETETQQLQIIPDLGGLPNKYSFKTPKGKWIEAILGYGSGEEARKMLLKDYRGAKLSPVPNRTNQGKYSFEGKEYQMRKNFGESLHQIHGFFASRPLSVFATGANNETGGMISLLANYDGEEQGYPFPYRLEVIYQLSMEGGFSCKTVVTNTGKTNMPLGDGWHPYLQLNGKSIDGLELQIHQCQRLLVNELMIPTGEREAFVAFNKPTSPKGHNFDDGFELAETAVASSVLFDPNAKVGIEVWQEAGKGKYKYLQIYTPPHRKAIAIEPMSCPADALNNGDGLLILAPNETWTASWGIKPCEN